VFAVQTLLNEGFNIFRRDHDSFLPIWLAI
jgi:hypothetical protein